MGNHPQLQKLADSIEGETGFYTGGPKELFEVVGRDTFAVLLSEGLLPFHRVLDFGCGSLRLAYWLVRFLDPECYYGIEPEKRGVDAGLRYAIGPELEAFKRPTFAFTDSCDMTTFGVTFDYVVARSILTHTCPALLNKTLETFAQVGGIMVASYWPADLPVGKHTVMGDDCAEDDDRFHPRVLYSLTYMQAVAARYGLEVRELDREPINEQVWLRISR